MIKPELLGQASSGQINEPDSRPSDHWAIEAVRVQLADHTISIRDVPVVMVDDEMCRKAIAIPEYGDTSGAKDAILYLLSEPHFSHLHEEVALHAIDYNYRLIVNLESELLTKDFMIKLLKVNGNCLLPFIDGEGGFKGLCFEVDQELIDTAISHSYDYFDSFRPEQYTVDAVKACLRCCEFNYDKLKPIGRYHVLTDLMHDEGHWPSKNKRPHNLPDAVTKMMNSKEDRSVYHAYLRKYDMKDVLPLMRTPARRIELLSMLTDEEAKHYLLTTELGADKHFKIKVLENDLGL